MVVFNLKLFISSYLKCVLEIYRTDGHHMGLRG